MGWFSDTVGGLVGGVGDIISGGVDIAGDMLKPAEKVFKWSTENPLQAAALAAGGYYAAPTLFGGAGAGAAGAGGGGGLLGGLFESAAPEVLGEASGAWATSPAAGAGGAGILGGAANWASANPLSAVGLGLTAAKALGGSTPSSTTTTSSIDPEMKAAYLRNLEEARGVAGNLQAKRIADFSGNYATAEEQLRNLGLNGVGQRQTAEASRLTGLETGYTPEQIAAAQINRGAIQNIGMNTGAQFMGQYQNPYENQVVQSALNDIELARQRAGLSDRAAATAAKAFGGSRQGVAEALTNEAALRNAATTAANLRSTGFTTAAQLAQTDAARLLQAQMANQGVDLTTEQANAQLRQQAKLANQSAIAQGAGIRLSAAGQLGTLGAQQQNLGIAGAKAIMDAEAVRQAQEQARLDAERNLALERLSISQAALGLQPANLGGSQTTPLYTNTGANLLGGALGGATLGKMIGGTEGAGYGALAGGLLGLIS